MKNTGFRKIYFIGFCFIFFLSSFAFALEKYKIYVGDAADVVVAVVLDEVIEYPLLHEYLSVKPGWSREKIKKKWQELRRDTQIRLLVSDVYSGDARKGDIYIVDRENDVYGELKSGGRYILFFDKVSGVKVEFGFCDYASLDTLDNDEIAKLLDLDKNALKSELEHKYLFSCLEEELPVR